MITRDDGFTDDEGDVADAINKAVRSFGKLPREHPDEAREFVDAIHRIQSLMAMRIIRRCYPKVWPGGATLRRAEPRSRGSLVRRYMCADSDD